MKNIFFIFVITEPVEVAFVFEIIAHKSITNMQLFSIIAMSELDFAKFSKRRHLNKSTQFLYSRFII